LAAPVRWTAAAGGHAAEEVPGIVLNMPAMPRWKSVTRPQRGLLLGIVASVLAVATLAMPASVTTSTTQSLLLWRTFVLNALLLLGLGPVALVTTRRWFRQGLLLVQLRRERRAVRRRAVLLGLIAYVAHQTLVVLLDPRFSLERLTGRRRAFGPVVTVPDRLELAWAFTAVALGYVILAWLLWRSARVPGLTPTDARPARSSAVLEGPPPPTVATASPDAVEVLPRDPVTGRVVRQFDL